MLSAWLQIVTVDPVPLAGLVWSLTTLVGCASCAGEGEYCVEEDCCDDLTCTYVESQGYRCK